MRIDRPAMMSVTATRISKTPVPMRSVNRSPEDRDAEEQRRDGFQCPEDRRGRGADAADGPAIVTSETIVGKQRQRNGVDHIRGEGTACKSAPPRSRTT